MVCEKQVKLSLQKYSDKKGQKIPVYRYFLNYFLSRCLWLFNW